MLQKRSPKRGLFLFHKRYCPEQAIIVTCMDYFIYGGLVSRNRNYGNSFYGVVRNAVHLLYHQSDSHRPFAEYLILNNLH